MSEPAVVTYPPAERADNTDCFQNTERTAVPDNIVASNQWGQIICHDEWNTLELRWLPATRDATETQARDTMVLFAAETEKRKPAFLIVDTTEFLHRWADDFMAWRNEEIIPHYNSGGVTRFAFIAGDGVPFPTVESGAEPAPEGPATFPTGWFQTREAAYQWLAAAAPTANQE